MFAKTSQRVAANTAAEINRRNADEIEHSVRWHATHPGAISRRIEELEREWDIERALQANAATAVLIGVSLGATVDRKFFFLPGIVAGFLLQHAFQGWCPPLPVLRRLGLRTSDEIAQERYALKALRGDFAELPRTESPNSSQVEEFVLAARIH